MFLPLLDLTDNQREEPLEIKLNSKFPQLSRPQLNKEHMIPTCVVRDIIMVYEFGDLKDLNNLPNNLVCMLGGSFWTTWDYILSLKPIINKIKNKSI